MPRAKLHTVKKSFSINSESSVTVARQAGVERSGTLTVRSGMLFYDAPVSTEARGSTRSGKASRLMDVLVLRPTCVDFLDASGHVPAWRIHCPELLPFSLKEVNVALKKCSAWRAARARKVNRST